MTSDKDIPLPHLKDSLDGRRSLFDLTAPGEFYNSNRPSSNHTTTSPAAVVDVDMTHVTFDMNGDGDSPTTTTTIDPNLISGKLPLPLPHRTDSIGHIDREKLKKVDAHGRPIDSSKSYTEIVAISSRSENTSNKEDTSTSEIETALLENQFIHENEVFPVSHSPSANTLLPTVTVTNTSGGGGSGSSGSTSGSTSGTSPETLTPFKSAGLGLGPIGTGTGVMLNTSNTSKKNGIPKLYLDETIQLMAGR